MYDCIRIMRYPIWGICLLALVNTSAQSKLEIVHNSKVDTAHISLVESELDHARINLMNSEVPRKLWSISGLSHDLDDEASLKLSYFDGADVRDIVTVKGDGSVGINNSLPGVGLDIGGKICISDDLFAAKSGSIRFKDHAFQGYDGTGWVDFGRHKYDSIIVGAVSFSSLKGDSITKLNGQGGAYISISGSTDRMLAPVALPAGSRVEKMEVFYKDEESSRSLEVKLNSEYLQQNFFQTLSIYTSTDAVGWVSGSTVDSDFIYGSFYTFIEISGTPTWPGDDKLAVKGVKLVYRLP